MGISTNALTGGSSIPAKASFQARASGPDADPNASANTTVSSTDPAPSTSGAATDAVQDSAGSPPGASGAAGAALKSAGPSAQTRNAQGMPARGTTRATRVRSNAAANIAAQASSDVYDAADDAGANFGTVMANALGRGAGSATTPSAPAKVAAASTDSPASAAAALAAAMPPTDAVAWIAQVMLPAVAPQGAVTTDTSGSAPSRQDNDLAAAIASAAAGGAPSAALNAAAVAMPNSVQGTTASAPASATAPVAEPSAAPTGTFGSAPQAAKSPAAADADPADGADDTTASADARATQALPDAAAQTTTAPGRAVRTTVNTAAAAQPGGAPNGQVLNSDADQNGALGATGAPTSAGTTAGHVNALAGTQNLIAGLTTSKSDSDSGSVSGTDGLIGTPTTHASATATDPDPASLAATAPVAAPSRNDSTAATTTLSIRSTVGSAAFANEVSSHVTSLTQSGITQAQLQLNPADLGPVQVHITLQSGQASVWFGATHSDTRAALEQSLPRLREMFAGAGMPLTDSGVFREPPRQQQAPTLSTPNNSRAASIDTAVPATVTQVSNTRLSLLDTYA